MGRRVYPGLRDKAESAEQDAMTEEFMDWERAINDLGSSVENMAQKMSNVQLNRDNEQAKGLNYYQGPSTSSF